MIPDWLRQMVKFGTKGGVGMLANLVALTVVVDVVGIPETWGVPIVWAITIIPGYLFVDWWVFNAFPSPDGLKANAERSLAFYAVLWSGKGVNYLIYLALISVSLPGLAAGVPYQLAWAIGAIIVFPWNFFANRYLWQHDLRLRDLLGQVA